MERETVWAALRERLNDYLLAQGLPGLTLVLAPEPPQVNLGSGKLRHVLDVSDAAETHAAGAATHYTARGRPGPR